MGWYCLLSRNQPESAIPRTSMRGARRPKRDATRSRLSSTPVPPALKPTQLAVESGDVLGQRDFVKIGGRILDTFLF